MGSNLLALEVYYRIRLTIMDAFFFASKCIEITKTYPNISLNNLANLDFVLGFGNTPQKP